MKTKITIVIAAILAIMLTPMIALADSYDFATKTVVIDTAPTVSLDDSVNAVLSGGDRRSDVRKLIITDTVTYTFTSSDRSDLGYRFSGLTDIDIADTVSVGDLGPWFLRGSTSIVNVKMPGDVGEASFEGCTSLESVSLSEDTTIGREMFLYCTRLTSVSLPVAESFFDRVFIQCDSLRTISLPSAKTFREYTFAECDLLESVSLPSATDLGERMFYDCAGPIELTLGSTVPAITNSNIAYPPGSVLYVPAAAYTAYDTDPADTVSGGSDDHWFGWPLAVIPVAAQQVANPQTGEPSWMNGAVDWLKRFF